MNNKVLVWVIAIIWLATIFLAWKTYIDVPERDNLNTAVMFTALGLSMTGLIASVMKKK